VGYAGGRTPHPDYGNIGDHTETVQLDYDPRQIRYEDLLTVFWDSHQPASRSFKRQYLHAVFYHDPGQEQAALASRAAVAGRLGGPLHTEVLPLRSFTLAEDYHQKYLLKRESALVQELARIYPRHRDFVDSTAAARLNGYAGGYGGRDQLAREIDLLGLSPAGRRTLEKRVQRSGFLN
jgi:methionine-S-sulfoxide reductase